MGTKMTTIEKIIIEKLENLNYAVYKYVDIETNLVKYIGIVNNGSLANRHRRHMRDDWYKSGKFKIEYIQCNNQSETESIESHLISLYSENQLYNKAKQGWGLNKYLPNDYNWNELNITIEDLIIDMKNFVTYSKDVGKHVDFRIREWINLYDYIKNINFTITGV